MTALATVETLVREDIADTCRCNGISCAGRLALVASTPEEWRAIRSDVAVARSNARDLDRQLLRATRDACDFMADGAPLDALHELADHCGLSVEEWVTKTSAEVTARKGDAR